jgi:hypothetical protein
VSASLPPPSQQIPGKSSGSGPYLVGILVLGVLMAGLLYWKLRPEPPSPPPPAPVVTLSESKPKEPAPIFAPPPPPPEEVEDAGAPVQKATPSGPAPSTTAKGPCSAKCGEGKSSPALLSAINAAAGSARGCYNRALRTSEVSGKMTVRVQVGSTGSVCSAEITNDTVGSGEIASCVLGRFRGRTLPAPQSGCIVVDVPINFTIKQ